MPQFFIDRPKFAWVIAILLLIAGGLSFTQLPVAAYPSIAPPQVTVTATYPGASAKTIEDTVTSVIEDEMNGIEGLKYIASESSRAGTATITLTFETGTDTNIAAVDVQNRLKRVEARLPSSVNQQGVNIDKTRPDFLMIIALHSPNGTYNATDLGDYIDANVISEIRRLPGVGSADLFGSKYAMRIWIDPKQMTSFSITPDEIVSAIQSQNAQLATGELGALPSPSNQQINATVLVPSRLSTVEEFGQIILRSSSEGAVVRLRDIARVERGAQSYATNVLLNGQPAAAFATKLSNTGNALVTAQLIKEKMDELQQFFPEDIRWMSPYDTSLFVDISIAEVKETLIIAIILVTIVMFVFLQNWRTTLIPLIVVPISLIGTAIGMYLFGFSINMLTMFGMVLAIGIVVDDAILVVENIQRLMEDEGLGPYQATKKSMQQISGAIIGTTAVLVAVFVPMAFISGSVGQIYKQFSLTIIISVCISSFLALSLSPAMAQGLLKAKNPNPGKLALALSAPGQWFNRGFARLTDGYMAVVKLMLTGVGVVVTMLIFAGIGAFDYQKFNSLPKGFVPSEDQGFVVTGALLPSGATQERSKELADKTDAWLKSQPEIKDVITVLGFGFLGSGQNTYISFANLHPWDERTKKGQRDADQIVADAGPAYQRFIGDGIVFAFNMPPIPGLGNDNGFDFRLQDRSGNNDPDALMQAAFQIMGMAAQGDGPATITGLRPNTLPPAPQIRIDVDRIKARSLDVDIASLNSTLQIAMGSAYVNDYVENGKVHQVWVQADQDARSSLEAIMSLQVRNTQGGLVDLKEIASAEWIQGPAKLNRYNGVPSIPLSGAPAPGASSGDAIAMMEAFAAELPKGFGFEWSGQSLEEKISGGQTVYVFALSIIVVFLVLVALYESWAVPLSVMLVVPLGVLGCVLAVSMRGLTNDVYFTVGIITIIGLSTKNAIVIVEFSRDLQHHGKSAYDAVVEACKLRFRPILMTSFAFVLGVIPLAISTGAGSASRRAIGTGVLGGMLSATVLAVLFVPVFYLLVRKLFPAKPTRAELEAQQAAAMEDQ
ncbi:multidrug efflux RND transporter permease subunit [Motiliproteus coralliicola]|uniref:Efflux pump membrane transporter n=1 Tax=Motiliproteus coralliicola TaxID=2283196 RepID=A0A369WTP7_9GAMM|nr:multidrug efflux RND transporter permease subunit [Motiliproteus coralliicola]RDE24513.1 multidrug efflux RND transporter permease subunit [Motiliproteus coralliicola]